MFEFSNLKNVWCSSVAFKVQCMSRTVWSGRCELVASRGNSVVFRVVGVRLLQVVAILFVLSLAVFRCSRWEQHGPR